MKKIMSLLFLLVFLAAIPAANAEAAGNRLGFEVLKALGDGTENQVISPVSLAYALAMAAQGAGSETEKALLEALEVDSAAEVAELTDALQEAGLKLANAAFSASDLEPDEAYVQALQEQFGAEWFAQGEDLEERINAWVAEKTDGLIEKLYDGPIDPETALILLNAIAMDADWASPFRKSDTADGVFHAPDGEVTVPFMNQTIWARYGERDGVQLLRLEYADSNLVLLLALPEEGGVPQVLDGLAQEGLAYFQLSDETIDVDLSMPKLDISVGESLAQPLQDLGLACAFDERADFSGISKDVELCIGDVLQKARLVFDEEGTRAAAATSVEITPMMAPIDHATVRMALDRPFVAVIADEQTGAVSFASIVANPVGN